MAHHFTPVDIGEHQTRLIDYNQFITKKFLIKIIIDDSTMFLNSNSQTIRLPLQIETRKKVKKGEKEAKPVQSSYQSIDFYLKQFNSVLKTKQNAFLFAK